MLNIFREIIINVIKEFFQDTTDFPNARDILINLPNENRGDLYTNAAMVFAKRVGMKPQELAEKICNALKTSELVQSATIAGPGFINFNLTANAWQSVINTIIEKGYDYSKTNIADNSVINVEFVSANPTGPLHTGHARNAVFGSVVANLLTKIEYNVTREFYINDQGNQIKSLARSVYLRYREKLGATITNADFTDDMYIGDYVKDLAEDVYGVFGDSLLNKEENEYIDELCNFCTKCILQQIKKDLASINVVMDVFTSEKAVCASGDLDEALAILAENGCIYEGIMDKPKGIEIDDWEPKPQTIFASTKFGDDSDRPIRKSDGSLTYFAGDIAYHFNKIKRGFMKMINVLGADHNGYVTRLKSAVKAISNCHATLEVKLYQLVNFLDNGVPVRMSKRSGNFITLREVVERVGCDITRYMMISRDYNVMIDFDFTKVCEFSMENPLFYMQYAYARICSVFRHAEKLWQDINDEMLLKCEKSTINDKTEIDLIKLLCFWPEYVANAAIAIEPHRIPNYLHDIAAAFHALWNAGKLNTSLRFIDENNKQATIARLALLRATAIVLEDGMDILGITPMKEMH